MTDPAGSRLSAPGRVLLVESSASCDGGAQMMLDEILQRADTARYEVSFAGLTEGPWAWRLRQEGCPVHVVTQTRWRDVRTIRTGARQLGAVIRSQRIDLVHASGAGSLLMASLGARNAGTPFVWNVFGPLTGRSPRKLLTARRQVTARMLGALHPDAIIFGTDRAAGGIPRRRSTPTATILPGIDPARAGRGDGARARKELGIRPDAPVLAMFGRLTYLKNQPDLVRAMPVVSEEFPEVRAVICGGYGESGNGHRVRALRRELDIEGRVLMTGFVPDQLRDDIMAAADRRSGDRSGRGIRTP